MLTQPSPPWAGRSATSRANSLASAAKAAHYAGAQAQLVLMAIRQAGPRGATDWDVIALTGISRSSLCARRNALMDAGLVVEHPGRLDERTRVAGPWQRACTVYVTREDAEAIEGRALAQEAL